MSRTLVVLPGDGIGPQVVDAALVVLSAVGYRADVVRAEVGFEQWRAHGDPLPARTIALVEQHGHCLFGAITSKPLAEAERALAPALQGRGLRYESPVLTLRRRLGLQTMIRPCRSFAGNPTGFVRGTAKGLERPDIDVVLVAQSTECLYAGVEWTDPPRGVRAALEEHPAMAPFAGVPGGDLAISARVLSRDACRRAAEVAFQTARGRPRRTVTLVDKWGVMQETASLFLEAAQEVAARFPDVAFERMNVDAAALALVRRPERFDVVLASALIGDILSDGLAGAVGGMGFAPSASYGARHAVFEPSHGSAPRQAACATHVANPIAAILAAAMLLDHVGEGDMAEAVRRAVARVVADGRVRTYDMLGVDSAEAAPHGAATTEEMSEAIAAALP